MLGGRHIVQNTREYNQNIRGMYRARHNVKTLGLECITKLEHAPRVKLLRSQGKCSRSIFQSAIKVDIVLGMVSRSLQCRDGYDAGNLRLNRRVFGPGWVLKGQAPARGRTRKMF